MELEKRIEADLTAALRSGDTVRKGTLRLIRAALKNASIEAGGGPLGDDAVVRILEKQAKERGDSIEHFERAGRADLVAAERRELEIVMEYLPPQASDEAIEAAARRHVEALGASGLADMGQVVRAVKEELKGTADGRRVSEIVRRILAA